MSGVAISGVCNVDEVARSGQAALVGGCCEGVALIYGRAALQQGMGLRGTAVVSKGAE